MKILLTLLTLCAVCTARAEMLVGVQLFDMYKTEAVSVMDSEAFRTLKAELNEEKSVFNKALAAVKRDWDKQYADARKAGDKEFPKYPSKPFVWVRAFKAKNFATQKAADEWFAKQDGRVKKEMTAKAAAIKKAQKAAKGMMTKGYSSRDDKKERRHAEKDDLNDALREKLGEMVELQMASLLKLNRPVPKHFIMDPIAGAEKDVAKQIEKQEVALKAYQERKAKAEATEDAEGKTPAAPGAPAPQPTP